MTENNSADRLSERILNDARTEVDALIHNARERVLQIQAMCDVRLKQIHLNAGNESQRVENLILAKNRTDAELEAKKYSLKKRHEIINRVFEGVLESLYALNSAELVDFLTRLIIKEAPAKCDVSISPAKGYEEAVSAAVTAASSQLAEERSVSISISESASCIKSGFLMYGTCFEKKCSFEAITEHLRDEELVAVSEILFK